MLAPLMMCLTILSGFIYRGQSHQGGTEWIYTGCGFFGFQIAIVCCVASETKATGWRRIAILASVALFLELISFIVLPAHLALTQYRSAGMMVVAGVGGIWLVSLLVWAANVAVGDALRRLGYKPAVVLFGILAGIYALGLLPGSNLSNAVRVGAIQTDDFDKDILARLNSEAGKQGAVLTVWPEFSGLDMCRRGDTKELRAFSQGAGQPAFVTSFPDSFEPLPHNTAALLHGGKESAHYFKRKLFGGEVTMHTPGSMPVAVPWADGIVALDICYDSCYPGIIQESANLPGVNLIALPTNDPDCDHCFVAAVHASFTPFRAAESGVAIVKGDGGAHSMIVDNTGRIVAELGSGPGWVVGSISPSRRWTLYSILGDWALYLSLAYLLAELGLSIRTRAERSVLQRI